MTGRVPRPGRRVVADRFWRLDAACAEVDPELFFPDGTGDHGATATRVCAGCSVRPECDALAVAGGDVFGVFGGRTAVERTGGAR